MATLDFAFAVCYVFVVGLLVGFVLWATLRAGMVE